MCFVNTLTLKSLILVVKRAAKFEIIPSERAAIGEKCREIVEQRFSLDTMHAGYEEIYTQLIDNRTV